MIIRTGISETASSCIPELAAQAQADAVRLAGEAEGAALRAKRLEINTLLVQKAVADRWDGHYPDWLMLGQGNENFLMQLPAVNRSG